MKATRSAMCNSPASAVKAEMKSAGYALASEHAFLPNQYFLMFKPN